MSLPQEETAKLPLQGYHVMIVDDVQVNRLVVETKLRDMGANVQCASNGRAAVNMILEAEQSESPIEFVLMDLQMPVMDGFEAARLLRQRGFTKPIVALTANQGSDEQAIESGCDRVLLKPATREILLGVITELTLKT
jgi:CheY-like chemotaxis protein